MLSTDDTSATAASQASDAPQARPPRSRLLAALGLATLLLQGCAGNAPSPADTASARAVLVKPKPAGDNIISRLYAHYENWRGTPYRLGGDSRNGIDCSALIQQTFRDQFDLELPRTTADLVKIGEPVAKDQLSAGDLVFFRTGRRTRHAGIYIEDGQFLHASSRKGVIISSLDNPYWSRHYWTARRPETPSDPQRLVLR